MSPLLMLSASCGSREEPLLELAALPSFELTAQSGAPFGLDQVRGHVSVANFIFTSCPSICPALTAKMSDLQRRFAGLTDVRLVSFSVDPERDTPERLREYGARYGANADRWSFVTGRTDELRRVVTEGFRVAMGDRTPVGEHYDIAHGGHFVLIDRSGTIRGYYPSDAEATERLVRDVHRLVEESQ